MQMTVRRNSIIQPQLDYFPKDLTIRSCTPTPASNHQPVYSAETKIGWLKKLVEEEKNLDKDAL